MLRTFDGTEYRRNLSFTLVADTWTKVEVTTAGNSNLQIDNDAASGLTVFVVPHYGTDFTGGGEVSTTDWYDRNGQSDAYLPNYAQNWANTASATFDITGVQLELGDTATPFEHRSFADELARCQRYYEKSYNYGTAVGTSTYLGAITMGGGTTGSTTSFSPLLCPQYKVRKRTAPTVTVYDPAGTSGKVQRWQLGITNSNGHTGTLVDISETNFKVYSNSGANSSGITCHYEATAEL